MARLFPTLSTTARHTLGLGVILATLAPALAFAPPFQLQSNRMPVDIPDAGVVESIPTEALGIAIESLSILKDTASELQQLTGSSSNASNASEYSAIGTAGNTLFDLSPLFYFNDGERRGNFSTPFTALVGFGQAGISRPVNRILGNYSGGSASPNISHGIPGVMLPNFPINLDPPLDFISGLPLGLFYPEPIAPNSNVVSDVSGGGTGSSGSGDNGTGLPVQHGPFVPGGSQPGGRPIVVEGPLALLDITIDPTPVPAPTTLLLFGLGLVSLGLTRRRKSA